MIIATRKNENGEGGWIQSTRLQKAVGRANELKSTHRSKFNRRYGRVWFKPTPTSF